MVQSWKDCVVMSHREFESRPVRHSCSTSLVCLSILLRAVNRFFKASEEDYPQINLIIT